MKDLSMPNLIFAAILLFVSGYILGIGQNLSGGNTSVTPILDKTVKVCYSVGNNRGCSNVE